MLGIRCCEGFSLVVASRLLTAVASLVAECGLTGSIVAVHRLSCSTACGIFPDQELNLCPLHGQADS